MTNIAIVGAGYMGTATAWPLTDNGHTVRLVGTHLDNHIIKSCQERHFHPKLKRKLPEGVRPYYVQDIADALQDVDVIVSGVNSLGVHWIGQTIGPYLQPGQSIIAVTKGLESAENGDLRILPDVLYSELPASVRDQVSVVAIGGPCIARELAARRQTCVVFGSRDGDAADRLAAIFQTPYYHVWTTTDLLGLEVCVALKNACTLGVALAAGRLEKAGGVDATGAGMHNLAAATFAQGCTEIGHMVRLMGGTLEFAYGLPGAGDLYVTCQGGRSMRLGKLLGMGHTYSKAKQIMAGETLEAAYIVQQLGRALPKLTDRGMIEAQDFPLLRTLADIVLHDRPADLALDAFFHASAGLSCA